MLEISGILTLLLSCTRNERPKDSLLGRGQGCVINLPCLCIIKLVLLKLLKLDRNPLGITTIETGMSPTLKTPGTLIGGTHYYRVRAHLGCLGL